MARFTATTYIIGAQERNYTLHGYCAECNDERDTRSADHMCGLNTPDEAIVHVVAPAPILTDNTDDDSELDLEDLPF